MYSSIIKKDEISSIERVKLLLQGEKIDRVPFFTFTLGFCAKNVGYPVSSVYSDPEKSFYAQLLTKEMYGFDNDPFYGYAAYGVAEFGGEVKLPEGEFEQAPSHVKFPASSEEDIDTLVKPDVKTAGFLPKSLEFSRLQQKHGMPVSLVIGGVFTVAGNVCPVSTLCRWLVKKPDLVNSLLRKVTDHLVEVLKFWADTFGAENIIPQIWEPTAANQIISPKQFEKFVLPFEKELHERILNIGIKHILCHICGDQNANLQFWSQIPMGNPGILSFGKEVDLSTAVDVFGEKHIIAGNIEPSLIQTESPDFIYEQCKQAIGKAKNSPKGFILMPGCEIPITTPPYNFFVMRKAINDFGWY